MTHDTEHHHTTYRCGNGHIFDGDRRVKVVGRDYSHEQCPVCGSMNIKSLSLSERPAINWLSVSDFEGTN